MKFAKISIILLLLIFLMGAVSATEEITGNAIIDDNAIAHDESTPGVIGLQSTQNDEYGVNEINTFTDFAKDMNESVNVMDVKHDYKFNNESDKGHIRIDRNNFVTKIETLKKRMRLSDQSIFVFNKIDETQFVISRGHVNKTAALKDVSDNYQGIFVPFKNQDPVTRIWRENNFDFIPFQTLTAVSLIPFQAPDSQSFAP